MGPSPDQAGCRRSRTGAISAVSPTNLHLTRRPRRGEEEKRLPYYGAALELLAESGYVGLHVRPLCQHLGLTTGAFYYSFASWQDFSMRFLDYWQANHTTRLTDLALEDPDPRTRMRVLLESATGLPHRAEAAIRVWSAIDPEVERLQKRVDDERHAALFSVLQELIGDDAELYARWGMMQLIGFEQSRDRDPELLRWSLDEVFRAALERR